MSALSLANLGMGSYTTGEPQVTKTGLNSVEAFQDAMSRSTSGRHDVTVDAPAATRDASAPQAVKPGDVQQGPPVDAASRERVRRSLGLEGASPAANAGDTILGGIQKLRSVFDARQTHLNDIMRAPVANTQVMMEMQMEVAQYTIMVDVSSKLTGKASSSLDTLMKGQ